MSSHQDPYDYSGLSPIYHESDAESSAAQRLSYPPGPPVITASADSSSRPRPHLSVDTVENLLGFDDTQAINQAFDPRPESFLPGISSQAPGVGASTSYMNEFDYSFGNLPFFDYPNFDCREPLHQFAYTAQEPAYDYPQQPFAGDAYGTDSFYPVQDIQTPPTVHPHSSSIQLFSLDRAGPVDRIDVRVPRPTADSTLLPDGVNTATVELPNAGSELYSHSPVTAAASNQVLDPGPSRPLPSSPERKRLLPLSDDLSTRRVVPRHDRAQSVHSTSSDSNRRSHSRSDISGRGPYIPQERYTTSSIASYNTSDKYPSIPFVLDKPEEFGIPITDILDKTAFPRLRDGAQAFHMGGKKTFTLRIQWPGYKPWSKTIAAMDWRKSRGPVTRAKLAEATATAIRDVLEKFRDEPYDPDCAQWNVGPGGIQLRQICLVELHHVSRGSWQPLLCLLEPRH